MSLETKDYPNQNKEVNTHL